MHVFLKVKSKLHLLTKYVLHFGNPRMTFLAWPHPLCSGDADREPTGPWDNWGQPFPEYLYAIQKESHRYPYEEAHSRLPEMIKDLMTFIFWKTSGFKKNYSKYILMYN